MKNFLANIKSELVHIEKLDENEISILIEKTKKRINNENLDQILPTWFALVQEISYRKIGLKHFDTQLMA